MLCEMENHNYALLYFVQSVRDAVDHVHITERELPATMHDRQFLL